MHLIRHAGYEGYCPNPARYIGRTDPPLSAEGRMQAVQLGQSVPELQDVQVFASAARRASETAALAFPRANIRMTSNAMEIDYGRIEGLSVLEAARLYPELCSPAPGRNSVLDFRSVGGEAISDLFVRVRQVAADAELFDEVVLVSHAIFLSAMRHHLLGGMATDIAFGFCALVTLEQGV
ncbi:histidine phosphatase family protein [Bradyrhizobium sp. 21]|uniref:histidine phosphatase family protein n=1 Tax=Bradyrhizobium sp. 21 TaxID=2782666 RepID=UPI001FF72F25|nr:histidine phosphatase family protein [Bradyrhizobium sp. 21]